MKPVRVFVYDPGLTTGVVTAEVVIARGRPENLILDDIRNTMHLYHVKMPNEQYGVLRLWNEVVWFQPDVIVGEDFRLFPDVPHSPDPRGTAPDRILAMMDLALYLWREGGIILSGSSLKIARSRNEGNGNGAPEVFKQMPGERTIVDDNFLRRNDLWRTPKYIEGAKTGDSNHAMDALRHLVVWTRKATKR